MWIFLSIVIFIALILFVRVRVVLAYNSQFTADLRVLFVKYQLVGANADKRKSKQHKKMKKKQAKPKTVQETSKRKKSKPSIIKRLADDFNFAQAHTSNGILDIIKLIRDLAGALFVSTGRHLRVKVEKIVITVATDNAAKTAILFGAVAQSLYYLIEFFRETLHFKHKVIRVNADFTADKLNADVAVTFTLRLWQIAAILLKTAMQYAKSTSNKTKDTLTQQEEYTNVSG